MHAGCRAVSNARQKSKRRNIDISKHRNEKVETSKYRNENVEKVERATSSMSPQGHCIFPPFIISKISKDLNPLIRSFPLCNVDY